MWVSGRRRTWFVARLGAILLVVRRQGKHPYPGGVPGVGGLLLGIRQAVRRPADPFPVVDVTRDVGRLMRVDVIFVLVHYDVSIVRSVPSTQGIGSRRSAVEHHRHTPRRCRNLERGSPRGQFLRIFGYGASTGAVLTVIVGRLAAAPRHGRSRHHRYRRSRGWDAVLPPRRSPPVRENGRRAPVSPSHRPGVTARSSKTPPMRNFHFYLSRFRPDIPALSTIERHRPHFPPRNNNGRGINGTFA